MTKQAITIGAAAELCEISGASIRRWLDAGQIEGYRIPGSKHRRVYRDSLAAFLVANGMRVPAGLIDEGEPAARPVAEISNQ